MNNILVQEEIDTLLKGVQTGNIDAEKAKGKILQGIRPYDLTDQEKIMHERMPGLEIANERFRRFFRNSISDLIMKFVDVSIHSVEIIKFSEFMKTVPFPSSITIFGMEPLKGHALFVMEAPLVFAFVELFFGGTNALHVKLEGRPFTSIEHRVIKKMVAAGLEALAMAWTKIAPVKPEDVGHEMNPQFVTIVTPGEMIIKIEVHIEFEDFTGKLFLCIPYSIIEPVKEKLCSGPHSGKIEIDRRWMPILKEMVMDAPVELSAELGTVEITVGELMKLDVGSVINIGKDVSDELVMKVEGMPVFACTPGHSRGNQAVKITRALD